MVRHKIWAREYYKSGRGKEVARRYKRENKEKINEYQRRRYANISEEEKEKRRQKQREARAKYTPEQKARIAEQKKAYLEKKKAERRDIIGSENGGEDA
jgi:hypothetical protein